MRKMRRTPGQHQKAIADLMRDLTGRHNTWMVWQDFVCMAAMTISIAVDYGTRKDRADSLQRIGAKYTPAELAALQGMFVEVVEALEENQEQDFLGDLFMLLELGNHWVGQFFTPYNLCKAMASIDLGDMSAQLAARPDKPWLSINDPACGAGATLIAALAECKRQGIRQDQVLFVGQDLDLIAASMCYIQLSLLGVAGYIAVGDTLAHPCTTLDPDGLLPHPAANVWYTPGFYQMPWAARRMLAAMKLKERKRT